MKTNEINEEQNNKIISIHFEQFNSDKIQFIFIPYQILIKT